MSSFHIENLYFWKPDLLLMVEVAVFQTSVYCAFFLDGVVQQWPWHVSLLVEHPGWRTWHKSLLCRYSYHIWQWLGKYCHYLPHQMTQPGGVSRIMTCWERAEPQAVFRQGPVGCSKSLFSCKGMTVREPTCSDHGVTEMGVPLFFLATFTFPLCTEWATHSLMGNCRKFLK